MKKHLLPILLCLGLLLAPAALGRLLPSAAPEAAPTAGAFDPAALPAYAGEPWAVVNGDLPFFTAEDLAFTGPPRFSPLDDLERRGAALALVGPETLTTQPRGPIGQIKPPGWHTVRYEHIEGKYLYNRCHLIAYQLSGVNEEPLNLITGTRHLNISAMLPLENLVAQYIRETGSQVLYRVTPVYRGEDLVCSGVLVEAASVGDGGAGLSLCRYLYNVQPGVTIDYATGESWLEEDLSPTPASSSSPQPSPAASNPAPASTSPSPAPTGALSDYILNTRSGKFHLPDCPGAAAISEKNRQDYTGSREELVERGYSPCGTCKP